MTHHPTPDNGGAWWLVSGKERRLHGIPGTQVARDQIRAATDDMRPVPARAACGLRRRWWVPGLFSRLARTRCTPCCLALGLHPGYGTPANEAAIKHREGNG